MYNKFDYPVHYEFTLKMVSWYISDRWRTNTKSAARLLFGFQKARTPIKSSQKARLKNVAKARYKGSVTINYIT